MSALERQRRERTLRLQQQQQEEDILLLQNQSSTGRFLLASSSPQGGSRNGATSPEATIDERRNVDDDVAVSTAALLLLHRRNRSMSDIVDRSKDGQTNGNSKTNPQSQRQEPQWAMRQRAQNMGGGASSEDQTRTKAHRHPEEASKVRSQQDGRAPDGIDSAKFETRVESQHLGQELFQRESVLMKAFDYTERSDRGVETLRSNPPLLSYVLQSNEIEETVDRIRDLKRMLLFEEQSLIKLRKRRLAATRKLAVYDDNVVINRHEDELVDGGTIRDEGTRLTTGCLSRHAIADISLPRRCSLGNSATRNDFDQMGAKRFKIDHGKIAGVTRGISLQVKESTNKQSPSKESTQDKALQDVFVTKDKECDESTTDTPSSARIDEQLIPVTTNAETGGISVSISTDVGLVSSYQMLVRKSLEFCTATDEDVASSTKGRKKEIFLGQVGVRCKFCANRPAHWRGRGSVYYPGKLFGVYQAAQNMAVAHLLNHCSEIPSELKEELGEERRNQRILDRRGGGKKYWMESCYNMGLREREGRPGLFWVANPHAERVSTSSITAT